MHQKTKTAKRSLLSAFALSLALVATTSAVHGAGFAIYENDARSFAMGGATVGKSDDAAALFTNPAGITQLPGLQIKAGLSLIQPNVSVTTQGSADNQITGSKNTGMNDYTAVVPDLYATYRLTDNIAIGLGFFVPFGLKSDFEQEPNVWPGAYNNYFTEIKTYEVSPTIAYRLVHGQSWAKQISIAAGIAFLHSDIDLRHQQLLAPKTGATAALYAPVTMNGNGWDYGYNISLQWEVNDQIGFGIVYRSGFQCEYNTANAQIQLPAALGGTQNGKAKGEIDLPESWTFGLNYSPIAPLNIGIAATRTNWSSYDELVITTYDFPNAADRITTSQKRWSDVWRYSIGAEYQATNALSFRAGFVVDKDPVNKDYADYMVPSNDRQIFSVGLGWTINKHVTLDFAYGYVKIKSSSFPARRSNDQVQYDDILDTNVNTGHANVFSAAASFRF